MKCISNVAGAIDTGGAAGMSSAAGGRPPARRESTASRAGHRRMGLSSLLTIGARCCVISTDCIQNVDDSQPSTVERLPAEAAGTTLGSTLGLRPTAARHLQLAGQGPGPPPVVPIRGSALRVRAPAPAPA